MHTCHKCDSPYYRLGFTFMTIVIIVVFGLLAALMALANDLIERKPYTHLPALVKIIITYSQMVFIFYRIQKQSGENAVFSFMLSF